MRISDWSSDVCSSDLAETVAQIAESRARLDAKAADVDYSAFGSDALYDPENGFMNLGGKNALDAYQPTLKQLQDQRDTVESGIESTLAKRTSRQIADQRIADRSDARQVGKGGVSMGRTRWWP